MLNLLAAAGFAAFVVLGLLVAGHRKRGVGVFIAFTLAASFGPGLTQRDAWPFSSWPLAANAPGRSVTYATVVAVDATGREHAIDYRAWQPLGFDELLSWIQLEFPKLDAGEKRSAGAYLLRTAEAARARALAEGRVGYFDRFLGPLTPPDFLLHPRLWPRQPVPEASFTRLRFYSETLVLDDPARGGGVAQRVLDYEYP